MSASMLISLNSKTNSIALVVDCGRSYFRNWRNQTEKIFEIFLTYNKVVNLALTGKYSVINHYVSLLSLA